MMYIYINPNPNPFKKFSSSYPPVEHVWYSHKNSCSRRIIKGTVMKISIPLLANAPSLETETAIPSQFLNGGIDPLVEELGSEATNKSQRPELGASKSGIQNC